MLKPAWTDLTWKHVKKNPLISRNGQNFLASNIKPDTTFVCSNTRIAFVSIFYSSAFNWKFGITEASARGQVYTKSDFRRNVIPSCRWEVLALTCALNTSILHI